MRKLTALAVIFGNEPLKCERVSSRGIDETYARYQYLIQWKGGTIGLNIDFYHVGDEWKLIGFLATADGNSFLANAAWDPQTRQAAKPRDTSRK